jgi:hypothetical protein
MKHKKLHLLFSILLIVSLLLSACDEDEYYDDEYYEEDPAASEESDDWDWLWGDEEGGEESSYDSDGLPTRLPNVGPGEVIYDFGFRPDEHGFSFENYGDDLEVTNLTADEMRRLFGDQVCSRISGDKCTLTPPARQWMEQINEAMGGGHCEGMAVLSLMMYTGEVDASEFGGDLASHLDLEDEYLQREIAYWWATQTTDPTAESVIRGTPMEILEIVQQMDANDETYTIGIYKPDFSGGHAITPFGVEDKGDGLYAILVYDNNYPGETRELYVDSRDNTWLYEAAINPQVESELYAGNAQTQTLDLTPTSARTTTQYCPFCGGGYGKLGGNGLAQAAQQYNKIFLDGEGRLLITDEKGNRLGYVDGKIVNEIPGANFNPYRMGFNINAPEPIYLLPADLEVTVEIQGGHLDEPTETDLVLIGPGFSIGVEQIYLEPGQVDTVVFTPAEQLMTYSTAASETPFIIVSIENQGAADYYFEIDGVDLQGGGTISVWLDSAEGDLFIMADELKNEGDFAFYMLRISDKDDQEFYTEGIMLLEGGSVYISYADWTDDDPEGLYITIDKDGDGVFEEEFWAEDLK